MLDATDPANPKQLDIMVDGLAKKSFPIAKTGGFKLGPLFVVGNLLVATNMGTGNNPCYSTFFNGNRLSCAGADEVSGLLAVHDLSDPSNIVKLGQSAKAGGKGEYVSVQDGFAHMGVEDRYAKIDLKDYRIVDNSFQFQGQEGFANVLGNLMLVTDDHSIGSTLIPHMAEPDRNPPVVNMVNPEGGEALSGRYSSQTNIVNFSPDKPLEANNTYAVVVPAGGTKDYAGNPTGDPFLSRFSTGAAINLVKGGRRAASASFRIRADAGGLAFHIPGGI